MESGAMPPDPTPPTPPTRRCAACLGASLKALALSLLCAGGLHVPAAPAATTLQIGDGSGARIEGSGRVGEEVRTTAPFSALTVAGPVDVQLKAGTAPRVTVRADDNLLPVITTEVIDRRLEVGVKPQTRARTRNKMVVVVEFTELTGILVRGSGDVDADRIQAALFEIVLRGSGDVKIERLEADALALSITGSGDVTVGGSSRALGVDLFGGPTGSSRGRWRYAFAAAATRACMRSRSCRWRSRAAATCATAARRKSSRRSAARASCCR
jgi:hypothetical protein